MPSNLKYEGIIRDYDGDGQVHFLIPDTLQDSKGADWNEIVIMNRSEPISTYSHSNSRTLTIPNILIPASMHQNDRGDYASVIDKVNFLQSFAYPDYSNVAHTRPPHRMLIIIGTWFNVLGILENCETNWNAEGKSAWNVEGGFEPQVAEVTLVVRAIAPVNPYGLHDIRRGDHLRVTS